MDENKKETLSENFPSNSKSQRQRPLAKQESQPERKKG